DDANVLYETGIPQVYTKAKELYETYQIKLAQGVRNELNKLDLTIPWRYRFRGDKAFFSAEWKEVGDALQSKTPIEKIRPALQPLARAVLQTGKDLAEYERIPLEHLMENYFAQQAEMPNWVRVEKAISGKLKFSDLSARDQQAFHHAERIAQDLQTTKEAGLHIYRQTHFGRGRPPELSPYLRGRTGAIPAKDHYRAFRARIEFSARKLYLEPALEKSFYLMQGYPESTKMLVGRHWDLIMGVPTDSQVLLRNSTQKLLTEATGGRYKATGREIEGAARFLEKMTAYNFVGLSPTAIMKHAGADHFNIWAQFGTRWWLNGIRLRRSSAMQQFAREQLKLSSVPEAAYEGLAPDVRTQLEQDLGGQAQAKLFFGAYNWRNQVQREVAGLAAWSKAKHYGTQIPEVKYWMEHYGASPDAAAVLYGRLGADRAVKKLTTFDVPLILQESLGGLPAGRLLGQFGTRKLQSVEMRVRAFNEAVRGRNYGPLARFIVGTALLNGLPFDEDLKI
ncbi:MAG: hypothetical protein KGJ27_13685, partial [candidate division NC10 bacterium]|nr:hypothetical protein [candidate division NC10 bacterium]